MTPSSEPILGIFCLVPVIGFLAAGRMAESIRPVHFLAMLLVACAVQIRYLPEYTDFMATGLIPGLLMAMQIRFFDPHSIGGVALLAGLTAATYAAVYFAGLLLGKYLRSRPEPPMYG